MKNLVRALSLAALCCAFGESGAQSWPTRPIRVIVSFAAGSAPDIICRFVTDRLSRAVSNRPGGGNLIAAQAAARSAPDGYNYFCVTAATLVSNPYTFKSLPYDPVKDFTPVAMIVKGPFFVLVHPSIPVKTLPELAAYDKANPGKLSYATDGLRNFTGMMAAWLNKISGTNILTVPYNVMPQGIQDTLAGRTQLVILAVPAAGPRIKSGELRQAHPRLRGRADDRRDLSGLRVHRLVRPDRSGGNSRRVRAARQPRDGPRAQGSGNGAAAARPGLLHRGRGNA